MRPPTHKPHYLDNIPISWPIVVGMRSWAWATASAGETPWATTWAIGSVSTCGQVRQRAGPGLAGQELPSMIPRVALPMLARLGSPSWLRRPLPWCNHWHRPGRDLPRNQGDGRGGCGLDHVLANSWRGLGWSHPRDVELTAHTTGFQPGGDSPMAVSMRTISSRIRCQSASLA